MFGEILQVQQTPAVINTFTSTLSLALLAAVNKDYIWEHSLTQHIQKVQGNQFRPIEQAVIRPYLYKEPFRVTRFGIWGRDFIHLTISYVLKRVNKYIK